MAKTRDELIREFFPPERTEPSYGYEIELIASWPGNEDRRDVTVSLKVDELSEMPNKNLIKSLVAQCEDLVPDGAVIISSVADMVRNLTDKEREV
ncbi:MAG TPA: hypothetical protein VEP90_27390 [Methylomirabilota bacterium]|nr:hypothetical protein [Methylomirabilota bacterium]